MSTVPKTIKEIDGWHIIQMLWGMCLTSPEKAGFSVAHKSKLERSMPGKPEVFTMKIHLRIARKSEDAAFPQSFRATKK